MEYDDEIQGGKNSYTTQFRQYDPRLGRWKSLDPLMAEFSSWSPYVGFNNNPIYYNDPLGLAAEGGWPCWSCWAETALPFVSAALDMMGPIGYVKGIIESAVGYSMDGTKLEPWERVANLVPGGAIFKSVAKVVKTVVKITKVVKKSKVVDKVKKVVQKTIPKPKPKTPKKLSTSTEKVHGNSKKSMKDQHIYKIVNEDTGETYKYGISGQKLNKNGSSKRLNKQLKDLNKEGNFSGEILQKKVPGRQKALDIEQDLVNKHAKKNGGAGPDGNVRPQPNLNSKTPNDRGWVKWKERMKTSKSQRKYRRVKVGRTKF